MIDLLALHEDALWIWSSVRSEEEYDQAVEFLRTDDEFRNLTMKRLDKSEKEIEDYITRLKTLTRNAETQKVANYGNQSLLDCY